MTLPEYDFWWHLIVPGKSLSIPHWTWPSIQPLSCAKPPHYLQPHNKWSWSEPSRQYFSRNIEKIIGGGKYNTTEKSGKKWTEEQGNIGTQGR